MPSQEPDCIGEGASNPYTIGLSPPAKEYAPSAADPGAADVGEEAACDPFSKLATLSKRSCKAGLVTAPEGTKPLVDGEGC